MARANDSEFGLAGAVISADEARCKRVAEALQVCVGRSSEKATHGGSVVALTFCPLPSSRCTGRHRVGQLQPAVLLPGAAAWLCPAQEALLCACWCHRPTCVSDQQTTTRAAG